MNNILIPRNLDSRIEKQKRIELQKIEEYINNGSEGDLDLKGTPLTKLPDNLTKVGGSLYINNSFIEDLNNLKYIESSIYADFSKLKSLPPQITRINGDLYLVGLPIDNIDNIKYTGGNLSITGTNINELPKGLRIEGTLFCMDSSLSKRFLDRTSLKEYLKERNIKVGGNIFW